MSEAIDVFINGIGAAETFSARQPSTTARRRAIQSGSRFETMARLARVRSPHAERLLRVLLDAARPDDNGGCEVLKPLWAEEAVHRAYSVLRLIGGQTHLNDHPARPALSPGMREALARDLAAQYSLLRTGDERQTAHCSRVLRYVVADLAALFGVGDIALETDIDWVDLPAYKRRALVLAAAELVTNALLHAFHGRSEGRIVVSLASCGRSRAVLRVGDDGVGFADARPNGGHGIASGLADLLEANLNYDRSDGWTTATIEFPADTRGEHASATPAAGDRGAILENHTWNERLS